jgi:hypothetical protein
VDVIIGDSVYELQFRVEKDGNGEEPQPIDMDAPSDDDNGGAKGNGNEDPMDEDGKDGKQLDSAPKQPPPNLPPTGGAAGGSGGVEQGKVLQTVETMATPKDNAASVGAVPKGVPLIYKKKTVVVLSPNGIMANGEQQGRVVATLNDDTAMLTEEAAAEVLSPVRVSKRNAATEDQDSLEKATKIKAQKNLDTAKPKGNLLVNPSFTSSDDFVLSDKAASLGISLGSDCSKKLV